MKRPSITLIFSAIFITYILHSIWTLAQLFVPPDCEASGLERCLNAYITSIPALGLLVYTSTRTKPYNNADVQLVYSNNNFDYSTPFERELTFDVPSKTHRNGSLYMHIAVFVPSSRKSNKIPSWEEVQRQEGANFLRISVTRYALPKMEMFKLLTEKKSENKPNKILPRPVTHIKKNVAFCMLSDPISFSTNNLPLEIARNMAVTKRGEYLPILQYDFVRSRLKDLEELTSSNKTITVTFSYSPIGIGKLRLLIQLETAMASLITLGFTEKDVDEVKSIIADTNVYLLCATVFIGSMHLLFDFLAFKNDVSFWRNKKSHEGLSARAVLWRAFSQAVIFLYLLDENTSLLVLIPSGIAMLIEFWKTKKIFKIKVTFVRLLPRINFQTKDETEAERKTNLYDAESMKYLSYVLYPLCIAGAVYSLLYESHRSWYSWTVHSIVNGVYAFGFLFMLPQLFVNYRLKSVAALPWRAFMYKAFNTFIDDVFAFIITMPTAHRFACFRDDIVFLIYLYQRWLYPVDKSRIDDSSRVFVDKDSQELIEKKKK